MNDASTFIEKAKTRARFAKDAWHEVFEAAKDDLRFLSDDPLAQWDAQVAQDRAKVGRPVLTLDQISQFVHQVSNDIRMNTPTINVIPAGLDSDNETAEIIAGRIKAIEYKSNADAAYDMAADFAVKSSLGFIRVDRGYVDDEAFEQEMRICRVVNPFAVLLDPSSTEPDGSDAKYVFILDEMSEAEFKERYPDFDAISFWDSTSKEIKEGEKIVVAEYFTIEDTQKEMGLLEDGNKEPVDGRKKYKTKRKVSKRVVKHVIMSGADILEETIFPGKFIPVVPVYGEEAWEDGKRKLLSLIRKSKSAQYMFNLWASLETELLLKQQQAPVMAAAGVISGFEDDWQKPDKAMVLFYNQTDVHGRDAPAPQRLEAPTIPTGIVNAKLETVEHIKASMGLYNTALGMKSNETSGIAIQRRDQQGDVATFHFGDNLVRSITHVGKIILEALPEVEDTKRIVHTIGKEEEVKPVGINGAMTEGQERSYDFTKGKYDVRVVTGASFTTQRQEAAAMYMEVVKMLPPEVSTQVLDLVFKYQDAPGSQALAERFKKMVDPKFLEGEKDGQDPQVVALQGQLQQVTAEAQQQIQMLQAELQSKQGEMELKQKELELKMEELRFDAEVKQQELQIKKADVNIKFMQASQAKEKPESEPQEMGTPDDSIEVLSARIQEKLMKQQQEQNQSIAAQQAEMMQAEQEAMREQQELELKVAEIQSREQQAQMLIAALENISGQVAQLTATVSQPITIQRDEQGNLIGAS